MAIIPILGSLPAPSIAERLNVTTGSKREAGRITTTATPTLEGPIMIAVMFDPNLTGKSKWKIVQGLRILGVFRSEAEAVRVARALTNC